MPQGFDVSVVSPSDGETVTVQNLLSGQGLSMAISTMVENFATFPPMATIVVVIIAGTVSHVAAAAYIILVPLGGLAFRAVGKSPILGIVVAYTAIASGYDASPVPTPNDAIFAGITTAAAQIIGPEIYVSPLSNWFFDIASSVLLAIVVTLVTTIVLSKRQDLDADPDAALDDIESLRPQTKERSARCWSCWCSSCCRPRPRCAASTGPLWSRRCSTGSSRWWHSSSD